MAVAAEYGIKSQTQILDKKQLQPLDKEKKYEEREEYKNIVLLLISAPLLHEDQVTSVAALSIRQEIDAVVAVLQQIPEPVEIEVIVEIATSQNLQRVLSRKIKPLIIHFIGHGMRTGNETALILEDKFGIARPFLERELRILLDGRNQPPCQLALLNACHSEGLAQPLVDSNIPHVIAINAEDRILDAGARYFAEQFYYTLFNQSSIGDAFVDARKAVLINDEIKKVIDPITWQNLNLQEYFKFHLLPPNSNHNSLLNLESLNPGRVKFQSLAENTNLNWGEDEENFVGRRIELYQIASDLDTHRCLALHGLGGMGKTALVRAAGRWQHERRRWKDGVWEVFLREVDSVAAARAKIVEILSEEGVLSPAEAETARGSNRQLARSLENCNMLLILDDLDQLIDNNANELYELLNQLLNCRQLKLLVTSRNALLTAKIRHHRREIQGMKEAEAVEVFRKYAPPQEEWNRGTNCQEDFDELIGFLEGYPMPIKLAASYLQDDFSSLSQLKQEIWRALRARDYQENPDRDSSLDITLEISYCVLPPNAQDMFPLLALFPAGISEELAACIRGDTGRYALRTLLRFSMAEKRESLSTLRITLPEPARRYAETKLLEGIKDDCYLKALEYFHQFAQDISQLLGTGEKLPEGKKRLLEEQANLYQCLKWGYESERRNDGICRSARITALLGNYWQWVIPGTSLLISFEHGLQAAKRNRDSLGEADLYKAIGDIQLRNQGITVAQTSYQKAIDLYQSIFERLNSDLEKAEIMKKLAVTWEMYPQLEEAIASYVKAFDLYQASGEILESAQIKVAIGNLQQSEEQLPEALKSYEKALELYQSLSNERGIAKAESLIRRVQRILQTQLVQFDFATVTVNRQGEPIKRATKTAQYFTEDLDDDITLEMVAISGGKFLMGAAQNEKGASNDEYPQHEVTVQPFFMGKYTITQAQWRAIASRTDLKVKRDLKPDPSYFKGDDRPVEQVSWSDAVEFCARLSKLTGWEYRLPSEAEWEYACRAGTTTPFYFGETITGELANYNANYIYANEPKGEYRGKTTPVGQFLPNAFGLYDMHGNVWEWCLDNYHTNYTGAPNDGSAWTTNDNNFHLLRGGSWSYNPRDCRSASRSDYDYLVFPSYNYGFRVVCVPPRNPSPFAL